MKRLEIIFLFLIMLSSSVWAATYTGTKPKDLDVTTPTESNTKVSEFNNSDREIKTVITNLENITTITGTYTVGGTQTGILGSSTSAYTISFPTASTLATAAIKKKYIIKNINTGTITLNLTVDGVGSPTVAGSQTFKLFTDGTSWFEERVNTAANANNAGLLDNLDSTYFTNATNLSTGTVNIDRIPGTLTGKSADLLDEQTGSYYTNASNLDSGTIPLARIPTTLTGKDADSVDGLHDTNIVQTSRTISTTAPLAGGGALSSNLTLSLPLATSGQNGYISSADWSTFNNKVSTSVTISTTTPLSGGGDLSSNRTIAMATATASQDGFVRKEDFQLFSNKANVVAGSGITSSSAAGTTTITNNGVLQIIAGTGISISNNGTGSPTITGVGTLTAGGWLETATQTVSTAGLRILAQGTIAVNADYGITGLTDAWVPNTITLDNFTQITTRNYDDISGTSTIKPTQIAIGTSTLQGALNAAGSATFSGTVTAEGFSGNGAGLTGITAAFSAVTGSATSNQLPIILNLYATTTTSIETETTGRYRLARTSQFKSENTNALLLHFDGTASSTTFTDSSNAARTVTAVRGAVISTAYSVFGGASLRPAAATGSYASIADDDDFDFGTSNFTIGGRVFFNTLPSNLSDLIKKGEDAPNKSFTVEVDATRIHLFLSTTGTGNQYDFPGTHTFALGTWTAWEICSNGSDIHFFINGNQLGAKQFIGTSTSVYNSNQAVWVGGCQAAGNWLMDGYLDEVYTIKGTALHTGTYTVPVSAYVASDLDTPNTEYYSYSMQYIAPSTNYALSTILDNGTNAGATYIFNYATTTAFGYNGTASMSSVGSSNVYSTESLNAELAPNFIVKSKDTKGRNFEEVTVSALDKIDRMTVMSWNPTNHKDMYRMDAEAMAKEAFVRQGKEDWKSLHELEYISKTIETGTGTINVIDSVKLDKAYKDYIELEWASSLNATDWINTVEDNAESDLTMRNYGLRLDDPTTPDELRKPGGIGLMDWSALNTKAIQELTAALGSATSEIEKLKAIVNP